MKSLSLIINATLAIGLVVLLNNRIPTSQKVLPAFGKVLNPFSGIWQNANNADSYNNFELDSEIVQDEVSIIFDERLVPHIYAKNTNDLFFAQGYVEAYLRLWQMDISWRSPAGRVSEVVGPNALRSDIWKRKLGLNVAAKNSVEHWIKYNDGSYALAQQYINGINHYISSLKPRDLPIEYKLLDYAPEKWDILKSGLIQKSMGRVLASHADDISMTNAKLHFNDEDFAYLFPERDPNQLPIIHDSKEYNFNEILKREAPENPIYTGDIIKDVEVVPTPRGIGSNNWAVAPEKSSSNNAILANDPHLNLTLPSIWYEVHLNAPGINAYGVSIPGIPGIIIGFNEDIAWGMTNVGHDVRDFYKIDWTDKASGKYLLDGKEIQAEKRTEIIKVAKSEDHQLEITETAFGPIYYEAKNEDAVDLAQHWLITEKPKSDELKTFIAIMQCKDYDCFKKASGHFESPAQNFLFASKAGDIALRINGNLPLKYDQEGLYVKSGNSIENKWKNFLPRDQNPQYENPPENYIGSANQVSAADNYPYYFTGGFEHFRGKRVYNMLEGSETLAIDDMKSMHTDAYSLKAESLVPLLLKSVNKRGLKKESLDILSAIEAWDFNYAAESKAAVYFEIWDEKLNDLYWDELKTDFRIQRPEKWRLLEIYASEDQRFADIQETETVESFEEIANLALKEMLSELPENELTWADYRSFSINHLAGIEGFGTDELNVGGHGDVLNANSYWGSGPSWRMIVELGDKPNALGVIPGGQSGDPASKFYMNGVQLWENGNYYDLNLYANPDEQKDNKLFEIKIR